jgi:hypothetical protein
MRVARPLWNSLREAPSRLVMSGLHLKSSNGARMAYLLRLPIRLRVV